MHSAPQARPGRIRGGGNEDDHRPPPEFSPRSRISRRRLYDQVARTVARAKRGADPDLEIDPDAVAALPMVTPLVVPPIAVAGVIPAFDPAHLLHLPVAVGNTTAVWRAMETGAAALARIGGCGCGGRHDRGRGNCDQRLHDLLLR